MAWVVIWNVTVIKSWPLSDTFYWKIDFECFGNMISLKYDIFESWYVIISFYVIRLYSSYNVFINIGQVKCQKINFDKWTKTIIVIWYQNIFSGCWRSNYNHGMEKFCRQRSPRTKCFHEVWLPTISFLVWNFSTHANVTCGVRWTKMNLKSQTNF